MCTCCRGIERAECVEHIRERERERERDPTRILHGRWHLKATNGNEIDFHVRTKCKAKRGLPVAYSNFQFDLCDLKRSDK